VSVGCRDEFCGEACAFGYLELGDDICARTIPADDEFVAELGAAIDADIIGAHLFTTEVMNGGWCGGDGHGLFLL